MNVSKTIQLAGLGLMLNAAVALAQSGNAEAGEISGYAGMATALGSHPAFGTNFGRAFSKYCLALIDTSYTPLGTRTLRNDPSVLTSKSRLYDFNFSMHIRVPVSKRWEPYAIVGGGFLYNTYRRQVIGPDGVSTYNGQSYGTFGFETGGGTRYYVTEDWGVRGEFRYTFSNHDIARVFGGVFYTFNGDFPFRVRHGGRRRHADPY